MTTVGQGCDRPHPCLQGSLGCNCAVSSRVYVYARQAGRTMCVLAPALRCIGTCTLFPAIFGPLLQQGPLLGCVCAHE